MSTCDRQQPPADALVLFGATGDLAKRKLFPALYHLERRGELKVPVIGVARSDWTDEDFRRARQGVGARARRRRRREGARRPRRSGWTSCRATTPHRRPGRRCATRSTAASSEVAVYYMAIPPDMFPTVATSLASVGLNTRGRIVVEKPFGRDLQSAQELNATLHEIFPEERIFRIDHYLGKEAVEDLLVFRFSNMLLEPVWNRNYVRSVQVTMAETIGVEGRGSFYEGVGAIRDVLQNHLLQVVSAAGDGAARRSRRLVPAGREGQGAGGDGADRPRLHGARPVHRLPRGAGCRPALDRRDVRRHAARASTRGAGPACRGTCASARR